MNGGMNSGWADYLYVLISCFPNPNISSFTPQVRTVTEWNASASHNTLAAAVIFFVACNS